MPLRVKIKEFLKKILPKSAFLTIVSIWRKTFSRFFVSDIHDIYTKKFLNENSLSVIGGPFAGMKYINESAGSTYLLKLIGCYESILHPYIEKYKKSSFDTIIDIGCAEGYYLIGLGINHPYAHLIGYDIDKKALDLTKKLALVNNLNRFATPNYCEYRVAVLLVQGRLLLRLAS